MLKAGIRSAVIGRRKEAEQVRQLLAQHRLVTLTGPGGIGKTTLAELVATDSGRRLPQRQAMVELAELRDANLVIDTVAGELGVRMQEKNDLDLVARHLGTDKTLLVLDNCEHLLHASAEVTVGLLRACPNLKVLATSRESLGIDGEQSFEVPALSVPAQNQRLVPESLGQYASVALFVERARLHDPTFGLTVTNAAAVTRLCRELDGVPLAIELAAARIRVLSPEALLERLGDRLQLLSRRSGTAPPRQQSLRASIEWSHDLCTEEERSLWARLSVFAGGWDLAAAENVCSDQQLPQARVLEVLESLVTKSVVLRSPTSGPARFRMLEEIRSFGVEQLDAAGKRDLWRHRHLDWFAGLVEEFARVWGAGARQAEALDRLRREDGNIRVALHFALDASPGTGAAMARQLHRYWVADSRTREGRSWLDRAVRANGVPPTVRAWAMGHDAAMATLQGDLSAAERLVDDALSILDGTEDDGASERDRRLARSTALCSLGTLRIWQGRAEDAIAPLRAAADLAEGLDVEARAYALFRLSFGAAFAGDFAAATEALEACLESTERAGEKFCRSYALVAAAYVAYLGGDIELAQQRCGDALLLDRELDHRIGSAMAFEMLALLSHASGDLRRAGTLLGAAEAIWRTAGHSSVENPYSAPVRDRPRAEIREGLGDDAFNNVFGQGLLMGDSAVAFALGEEPASSDRTRSQDSPLTRRESEVADLVGEGLTNREIAVRLVLSERTAEGHVENILRKLGFTSRTQISAWVVENRRED